MTTTTCATSSLADGGGAIIGSFLGSPFPPAVYIGHPGLEGRRRAHRLLARDRRRRRGHLPVRPRRACSWRSSRSRRSCRSCCSSVWSSAPRRSPRRRPAMRRPSSWRCSRTSPRGPRARSTARSALPGRAPGAVGNGPLSDAGVIYDGMAIFGGGAVVAGLDPRCDRGVHHRPGVQPGDRLLGRRGDPRPDRLHPRAQLIVSVVDGAIVFGTPNAVFLGYLFAAVVFWVVAWREGHGSRRRLPDGPDDAAAGSRGGDGERPTIRSRPSPSSMSGEDPRPSPRGRGPRSPTRTEARCPANSSSTARSCAASKLHANLDGATFLGRVPDGAALPHLLDRRRPSRACSRSTRAKRAGSRSPASCTTCPTRSGRASKSGEPPGLYRGPVELEDGRTVPGHPLPARDDRRPPRDHRVRRLARVHGGPRNHALKPCPGRPTRPPQPWVRADGRSSGPPGVECRAHWRVAKR